MNRVLDNTMEHTKLTNAKSRKFHAFWANIIGHPQIIYTRATTGLATVDPQTQGWTGTVICTFVIFLEGATVAYIVLAGGAGVNNGLFILQSVYGTIRSGGEIAALVYLGYSCGRVVLGSATSTSTSKRRIAIYLVLSSCSCSFYTFFP